MIVIHQDENVQQAISNIGLNFKLKILYMSTVFKIKVTAPRRAKKAHY